MSLMMLLAMGPYLLDQAISCVVIRVGSIELLLILAICYFLYRWWKNNKNIPE